jgi:hypothetical protein
LFIITNNLYAVFPGQELHEVLEAARKQRPEWFYKSSNKLHDLRKQNTGRRVQNAGYRLIPRLDSHDPLFAQSQVLNN